SAAFAPAKIEIPVSFAARLGDQAPVHEIVRKVFVVLVDRASVVGQDLISEIKAKHASNETTPFSDPEQPAMLRKCLLKLDKQLARKNRCPQPVHVVRVDIVKLCQADILRPFEPRLQALAQFVPRVPGKTLEQFVGAR